jgi:hypothetical protein
VAKKWANKNLPGALHFITATCYERAKVFLDEQDAVGCNRRVG